MKELTIYRRDFRDTPEADFFADLAIRAGIASSYEDAENIESFTIRIDTVTDVERG